MGRVGFPSRHKVFPQKGRSLSRIVASVVNASRSEAKLTYIGVNTLLRKASEGRPTPSLSFGGQAHAFAKLRQGRPASWRCLAPP